jgi:aminoglycoside phosphotransferase (APT) family kinase protein
VFELERSALAAGIPMPEPISIDGHVLVHRWVEGERVPEAPVSSAFGFEIGEILARLHRLDVRWTSGSPTERPPVDWPALADRALATRQPWAEELTAHVSTFLAIADFVETCERPGPVVLTHCDIQPWNLLARRGRPVVLDWELAGMLDLSGELGSTALGLAKGRGLDGIEPASFHAVLDGYVAGGGELPPAGPSWFAFAIGGWLGHLRVNVVRCLAGVETQTGPDLALSHDIVRGGVRGLPELYGRLPQLMALVPG